MEGPEYYAYHESFHQRTDFFLLASFAVFFRKPLFVSATAASTLETLDELGLEEAAALNVDNKSDMD